MSDPIAPNFSIRHDHFIHPASEDAILAAISNLERQMSELGDYINTLKPQWDALRARIGEDFAELNRQIEELRSLIAASQATDEEKANADLILNEMAEVDPLADFPPAPPVEPTPDEGGGPTA
jgi:DNA repair exonuclease SbcCD ATPase subunit